MMTTKRFTFAQKIAQLKALAPDAHAALEFLLDESLKQCRRDAREQLMRESMGCKAVRR